MTKMQHPIRYRVEWLALVVLRGLARLLPRSVAQSCGAAVGWSVMRMWKRRRDVCSSNLALAFSERESGRVRLETAKVFRNIGRTTFEILRISQGTSKDLLTLVDSPPIDILDNACGQAKGVLLLSGHIGNWELFAGWIRAKGYPLDVVVKPMRNPLSDAFYNDRRRELGLGIIHTQVATRGIVQALRNRRLVAIVADQYAGEDGIDVMFFGRKVSTPRGPAVLALKFGCPILSGAMIRKPDGRFLIEVDPPLLYEPTGDDGADIFAITQAYTTRIETHIRKNPDQWLWTHRRWRD